MRSTSRPHHYVKPVAGGWIWEVRWEPYAESPLVESDKVFPTALEAHRDAVERYPYDAKP